MNSVSEIYDDMGYNVADFDNSISQMGSSNWLIHQSLYITLRTMLSDSITKLVDFKSSGTIHYYRLPSHLIQKELASFISAPVTIGNS